MITNEDLVGAIIWRWCFAQTPKPSASCRSLKAWRRDVLRSPRASGSPEALGERSTSLRQALSDLHDAEGFGVCAKHHRHMMAPTRSSFVIIFPHLWPVKRFSF